MIAGAWGDLVHGHGFGDALLYGALAFFLALLDVAVARGRSRWNFTGVLFVGAVWLAVRQVFPGTTRVVPDIGWALVALAIGGFVAGLVTTSFRKPAVRPVALVVATIPGAVWLAANVRAVETSTARAVFVMTTLAIALALHDFDHRHKPQGAQWLLFAIAAFGIYVGVPDTDLARLVLAVAVPFALLSFPAPLARFGEAGAPALAGMLTWVAWSDGHARPASTVGAIAALGILLAEPAGRLLLGEARVRRRGHPKRPRPMEKYWRHTGVAVVVQAGLALYAGRIVANRASVSDAVVFALPALLLALLGSPFIYADDRRARGPSHKRRKVPARSHAGRS